MSEVSKLESCLYERYLCKKGVCIRGISVLEGCLYERWLYQRYVSIGDICIGEWMYYHRDFHMTKVVCIRDICMREILIFVTRNICIWYLVFDTM